MTDISTITIGSQRELRRSNRNRIFRALVTADNAITRNDLAQATGLNLPVVSRVSSEMLRAGLLTESFPTCATGRRGRRVTRLEIRGEGGYVIAVAITAYSQEIVLGNLKGHILYSKKIPEFFSLEPEDVLQFLTENIRQVLTRNKVPIERLLGGCVTMPRQVFLRGGQSTSKLAQGNAFWEKLQELLGIPMVCIRLAETLNLAENTWGVSRGFANVLCLHLTHVVGASLLHGGTVLPPPDRLGNIWAMPVARTGVDCTSLTGKDLPRVKNVASGMSILRRLGMLEAFGSLSQYTLEDSLNLSLAHAQATAGNERVQQAFAEAGAWMGYALETLYHVYQPDLVVLAGSMAENSYYISALRSTWESIHPEGLPVELRMGILPAGSAAALTALQLHIFSSTFDLDPILSAMEGDYAP